MNIFIGNLPFSTTDADVKALFKPYGVLTFLSLRKKSGKNARAFGLVTMANEEQVEAAINSLDQQNFMGYPIAVTRERIKEVKPIVKSKELQQEHVEVKPHIPVVDPAAKVIGEKSPVVKKSKKDLKLKPRSRGPKAWEKRKGRGTTKAWKKKPGGIKKKFRTSA